MVEVITIGEPLALFASTDLNMNLTSSSDFKKFLAGAEVNFAIGTKRLGHSVEYLSQVGNDPWGDFIIHELQKNYINTTFLKENSNYSTGIEFKNLTDHGDPETFYLRKNSAAANISPDFIQKVDLSDVKLAHLTGIFPGLSINTYHATQALIERLNKLNIPISFDPNLRPAIWSSSKKMCSVINEISKSATILLPGIKEARLLTGLNDVDAIMDFYFSQNSKLQLLVIKDGAKGTYFRTKSGLNDFVPSFKVKHVVDTVGAGDGFAVGLITALLEGKSIHDSIIRANAIGALAIQTQGDNTGYPTPEQLTSFLKENTK